MRKEKLCIIDSTSALNNKKDIANLNMKSNKILMKIMQITQ